MWPATISNHIRHRRLHTDPHPPSHPQNLVSCWGGDKAGTVSSDGSSVTNADRAMTAAAAPSTCVMKRELITTSPNSQFNPTRKAKSLMPDSSKITRTIDADGGIDDKLASSDGATARARRHHPNHINDSMLTDWIIKWCTMGCVNCALQGQHCACYFNKRGGVEAVGLTSRKRCPRTYVVAQIRPHGLIGGPRGAKSVSGTFLPAPGRAGS